MKRKMLSAALACLVGVSAMAQEVRGRSAEQLAVRAQVLQTIGDATCDSSRQCKTIAVISSACGGAGEHFAYSTTQTDISKLKQLVKRYGELGDEELRRLGIVLNCATFAAPGAVCKAGHCMLGAARLAH